MNCSRTTICSFIVLTILTPLISGCPLNGEADKNALVLAKNKQLQQENTQLETEINTRKTLNANLKMQLLEKNAEIKKLKVIQKGLGKEIVRSRTKIRFPKNKAEAVSILAETETLINTAKEKALNADPKQSFDESDQLMSESKNELDKGNYTKACYLAAQALEQVQTIQMKAETDSGPTNASLNHFVFPLIMQVTKMSNLREHPGMDAKVISVLKKGAEVTAKGYRGHWIQITVKDGPSGWVHYSLLATPEVVKQP